jgi:hypothetical protein
MISYVLAFALPVALFPLRSRSRLAYVFVLAAAWSIFAGIRLDIGGKDYFAYRDFFVSLKGFQGISASSWEPLFRYLAGFCSYTGQSFHGFFTIVALLGILPAVYVIDRHSPDTPLALFVYGIEFMLYGSFVILRAGIAIGLGFLAMDATLRKRYAEAIAWALLATGFHYSAVALLLLVPFAFELRPWFRTVLYSIAGFLGFALIFFLYTKPEILMSQPLFARLFQYMGNIAEGGGQRLNPLNILEVAALAFLLYRSASDAAPAVRNAFLLFAILLLFANIEAIFVRLGSFYKISVIFLIPYFVKGKPDSRLEKILGAGFIPAGISLYYLAKIVRWLLVNAGGEGGFLPYRVFFQ